MDVLRGLRDWNADINMDGIVTADELDLFLKERVTIDYNNKQTPQSKRYTSHQGEFVFIYITYIEKQPINFPTDEL